MIRYYKLNENNEVEFVTTNHREVREQQLPISQSIASDELDINGNHYRISTVFISLALTIDSERPEHFETMIFTEYPCKYEQYQQRYETYTEAIIGHQRILNEIKKLNIEIQ